MIGKKNKTNKECAQIAVAAAIVGGNAAGTAQAMNATLTSEEMGRAQAYLRSGKPVRGK
ncbi:hypothetical protein EES45_16565 [Streptomyces sp. ADI97-07]|uniref:hypothetical protein n=1 Tax=Streptomyces sp. ADI97-07 TaxID=1522762 RepID=UPI000F94A7E9|nr:hypothetical protein [Streptomyces sp. ADI97-07]RPK78875.1 hypothetical protein EES45_16565 [Streptomyces sp. ADI97-07]